MIQKRYYGNKLNIIDSEIDKLEKKIRNFKPHKHIKEAEYELELAEYLKNNKYNVKRQVEKKFKKIDIEVNNNIAIEIKGPTNMNSLKSIPDKINSYIPVWDYLFIIIFDINIKKDYTYKQNKELYNQKKNEILENIIELKKDKVFFIEFLNTSSLATH